MELSTQLNLSTEDTPWVNETIHLTVNGVVYYVVTDANGDAYLPINLYPGEYIVTANARTFVTTTSKITIV